MAFGPAVSRRGQTAQSPGLLHAQRLATSTLTLPTPWRCAVLCAWEHDEAIAAIELGGRSVPPSVTLVPRAVRGQWHGISFVPRPGDDGEEHVSFVYGRLRGRYASRFARRNLSVARVARHSAGFVSGMGLFESPLRFGSWSRWRSADELAAFAYGSGGHREAARPYRRTPWAVDHAVIRFGVV